MPEKSNLRVECLDYRCPRCKARAGQPCTYMALPVTPEHAHTAMSQARQALTGTPTKVPHLDRIDAMRATRIKAQISRVINKRPSAGVVAYRDVQRAEYFQMQEWLRANHGLLFTVITRL